MKEQLPEYLDETIQKEKEEMGDRVKKKGRKRGGKER